MRRDAGQATAECGAKEEHAAPGGSIAPLSLPVLSPPCQTNISLPI